MKMDYNLLTIEEILKLASEGMVFVIENGEIVNAMTFDE